MLTRRGLRLWLLGADVSQSPSPAMHNAALAAMGVDGVYEAVDVAAGELTAVLARLRAGEAAGANVTIPHKEAVARACDRLEGDAVAAGAVNTVTVEEGLLVGDTTDARGLEAALREQDMWPPPGATAVVLGAGGAAAAAVLALSRIPADRIVMSARRPEAAGALAQRLAGLAPALPVAWDGDALRPFVRAADVVVNATPVGVGSLPVTVTDLPPASVVVDLRYRPRPVDLVAAAAAAGLRGCDGAGMLLHQAALSLRRWTGAEPPLEVMRTALVEALR